MRACRSIASRHTSLGAAGRGSCSPLLLAHASLPPLLCSFSWISWFLWIGSTIISFQVIQGGVVGCSRRRRGPRCAASALDAWSDAAGAGHRWCVLASVTGAWRSLDSAAGRARQSVPGLQRARRRPASSTAPPCTPLLPTLPPPPQPPKPQTPPPPTHSPAGLARRRVGPCAHGAARHPQLQRVHGLMRHAWRHDHACTEAARACSGTMAAPLCMPHGPRQQQPALESHPASYPQPAGGAARHTNPTAATAAACAHARMPRRLLERRGDASFGARPALRGQTEEDTSRREPSTDPACAPHPSHVAPTPSPTAARASEGPGRRLLCRPPAPPAPHYHLTLLFSLTTACIIAPVIGSLPAILTPLLPSPRAPPPPPPPPPPFALLHLLCVTPTLEMCWQNYGEGLPVTVRGRQGWHQTHNQAPRFPRCSALHAALWRRRRTVRAVSGPLHPSLIISDLQSRLPPACENAWPRWEVRPSPASLSYFVSSR